MLEGAFINFRAAAHRLGAPEYQPVLMLTEIAGVDWFGAAYGSGSMQFDAWTVAPWDNDPLTLRARRHGAALAIVAGRQVVTAEGIEVLALLTRGMIVDGLDLGATVSAIDSEQALAVLPWGAGKWLGARGRIVDEFLRDGTRHRAFAGDNGGRPGLWPMPAAFDAARRAGRPVISGSDPLPLAGEECRAGSFGIWIEARLPDDQPGAALRGLLVNSGAEKVRPFGEPERAWRFVRNQLALRMGWRLGAA